MVLSYVLLLVLLDTLNPPPPPLHKGSSEQYVSAQKNIVFPYVKSPFPFPLPVYGQLPQMWHRINQSVSLVTVG